MRLPLVSFLGFALSLAGCTSSSPSSDGGTDGGGVDAGPVTAPDGLPYVAGDAIYVDASAAGFFGGGSAMVIKISDFKNACANESARAGIINGRLFLLGLATLHPDGGADFATNAGTYVQNPPASGQDQLVANMFFEGDGTDCIKHLNVQALSGQVVVSTLYAGTVTGKFTGAFPLEDGGTLQVSDSFSSALCSAFRPDQTPLDTCDAGVY